MIENEDLLVAYSNLKTNEKRNKLNNEFICIGEYIKYIENALGYHNNIDIKNYNIIQDKYLNEDEFLTCVYDDIYKIEKEIITISKIICEQQANK